MSDPSAPTDVPAAAAVQVIEMTGATAAALERLARSLGLDAVRIDLAGCEDKPALLERTAAALDFPAWFGGNWDAFYDCLADLGWRPARGYVLIVENTADMRRAAPEALDTALAILTDAAIAWTDRGVPFRAFVAA